MGGSYRRSSDLHTGGHRFQQGRFRTALDRLKRQGAAMSIEEGPLKNGREQRP